MLESAGALARRFSGLEVHAVCADYSVGADFDLEGVRHRAYFNIAESRIEMHLVSNADQRVEVAGERVAFGEGESIHTESSYKYSIEGFRALAGHAGFEAERVWSDPDDLFSVHCLRFIGRPPV